MEEIVYNYEKMEIRKETRIMVNEVYKVIQMFPSHAFGSQIRRAAVSVLTNLSEGTSRFSDKEKIRSIEISYELLLEVDCQMKKAVELNYINKETLKMMKQHIDKIANKLNVLRSSCKKRLKSVDYVNA